MLRIDINLVFHIINILIWAFIIKRFLFKPVENILEQRRQAIEAERTQAEAEKDQAKALRSQYEAALSGAKKERADIIRSAHEDARKEYNQIMKNASQDAETLLADTKKRAEEEKKHILEQAAGQLTGMIAEAAAKVAGADPEKKDQALYDSFLGKAGKDSETER